MCDRWGEARAELDLECWYPFRFVMKTITFYLCVTDNTDKWTEHLTSSCEICSLFLVLLGLCGATADKPLVYSLLQLSRLSMQITRLTSVETTGRGWWTVTQSSWVVLLLHITGGVFPRPLRIWKVWDWRLMHLECLFIWVWYKFISELGKVVLGGS